MISIVEVTIENFPHFKDPVLDIERASFPSPWSPDAFIEEINRPVSRLWALISDERLIGYICFWIFAREIHLMNIAVHPERRRKGHGSYLLNRMIREGRLKGAEKVWLEVRPSNLNAREIYQRAGFIEIGRRPGYYRDSNEDAIVMSLTLSPDKVHHRDTGMGQRPVERALIEAISSG